MGNDAWVSFQRLRVREAQLSLSVVPQHIHLIHACASKTAVRLRLFAGARGEGSSLRLCTPPATIPSTSAFCVHNANFKPKQVWIV
jgi:hypothetical protein